MTLFKQISLLMSLFLLLVLISVMSYNFQSAKQYAQEELSTTAQNTATYLSLSLSNTKAEKSAMSSMINALFDSGEFEKIALLDTNREVIFQRTQTKEDAKVPTWFTSMYDFKVPTSSATVSSGWNPIGTIEVIPMQENTHLKLYNNFLELLQSFTVFAAIIFISLFFLLRLILSSLKKMTAQAEAVSQNNFIINEDIPSTVEFKEVTLAMNKMVTKVKNIFEKEAASVKSYHKLLYSDAHTGLGNRSFFELKLNEYISSQEKESKGVILTVFLEGIDEANKNLGHEKVDDFISELFLNADKLAQKEHDVIVARLDGTKLSIIFANMLVTDIQEVSQEILAHSLVLLEKLAISTKECSIKLTQLSYTTQDTATSILDHINKSFASAQKNSILSLESRDESSTAITAKLVEHRIKQHEISLAMQNVYDLNDNILHAEAYVRLHDEENKLCQAKDFIPIIQELKLDTKLDKNVINHALKESTLEGIEIAINLSVDFVKDENALSWLKERLASQATHRVLNFEISNHTLLRAIGECTQLSKMLHSLGHNFAIDRFSIDEKANLNYLQMLKPTYLKIDSSYLANMLKDESGLMNPALQILTESIDTKIIATNIEHKKTKELLESAGIEYFQGSYLGEITLV